MFKDGSATWNRCGHMQHGAILECERYLSNVYRWLGLLSIIKNNKPAQMVEEYQQNVSKVF